MWKALRLFVVLHIAAFAGVGLAIVENRASTDTSSSFAIPCLIALLAGLLVTLRIARRSSVETPAIVAFTLFEGLFLGSLSAYGEIHVPGLVLQPVFACLSTVAAAFVLFAFRPIRHVGAVAKVASVALCGGIVFVAHNVTISAMTFLPETTAWGFGSPAVLDVPVSLVLSTVVILLTSHALLLDAKEIERCAAPGMSRSATWQAALPVMITIMLYFGKSIRAVFRPEPPPREGVSL